MKLAKSDELCAGGIVWRTIDGVEVVGLVGRTRYGDWTLPKGHVESGEAILDAAIREVAEELRVTSRATGFAGAIAYPVGKRQKYVLFWNLDYDGDDTGPEIAGEIDERAWLTPQDALARLTYPADATLLAEAIKRR